MKFVTASHTDRGMRSVNQDALAVQVLSMKHGKAVMAFVCDGLSGFRLGEEASTQMAKALSAWFREEFRELVWEGFTYRKFRRAMSELFVREHKRIASYGKKRGLLVGTAVCVLLLYKRRYYTVHMGHARAYRFHRQGRRLTTDQTAGKNILFWCVGSTDCIKPEFGKGYFRKGDRFLVCSDGFWRRVSIWEMEKYLQGEDSKTVFGMRRTLMEVTGICKQRGEKDDISACLIGVF